MTTKSDGVRVVAFDARCYDVVIVSIDERGQLVVAVHVRKSFADAMRSIDGTYASTFAALDARGVPRAPVQLHVSAEHDVEAVLGEPYKDAQLQRALIEKLRLGAGLPPRTD